MPPDLRKFSSVRVPTLHSWVQVKNPSERAVSGDVPGYWTSWHYPPKL